MTRSLLMAALVCLPGASVAFGGFVNGVERFDGTQFDTKTWTANFDLSDPDQTTAVQNDSLTLNDDIFEHAQYSTRKRLVRIGGGVRVDVTHLIGLNDSGGRILLRKDEDGSGAFMFLGSVAQPDGGFNVFGGSFVGGDGVGNALIEPGGQEAFTQAFSDTLTYEIILLSKARVQFSAYDPASGTLLGRTVADTKAALDERLSIVLETANSSARFDNVELIPAAIPLPPAVLPGGAVLVGMAAVRFIRSRRRGPRTF